MNNNNYAKLQKPTQELVSKYINEFNTRVILDLIDAYSLGQFTFKTIDKFLWRYGQEIFPPSY